MEPSPISFGTDGWRAIIGADYTVANVRLLTQALAQYWQQVHPDEAARGFVVAHDTRFNAEMFAEAAAEVLVGNGIPVALTNAPTPTPVFSHAIVHRQAGGGIALTASHNPFDYQGYKVRSAYGGATPPAELAKIEEVVHTLHPRDVRSLGLAQAQERQMCVRFDPSVTYLRHISQLLDLEGLRAWDGTLVIDAMYGAGLDWFSNILQGGALRVYDLHNDRNPMFPNMHNPEPIPGNLQELFSVVPRLGALLGLANDGDADRLGACDENGQFLNQLTVISLLALYLLEVRGQRGPIVKTYTSSTMLNRLGERFDVPVHETPVGFKFVAPKMIETDALLGGEESGGYAFRGHVPERDGILAGLFLLDYVVQSGRTPTELVEHLFEMVGPHFYDRLDLDFPQEERGNITARLHAHAPTKLANVDVAQARTEDGFHYVLTDGAWVCVRFSGTEPIMRIYAEANSNDQVQALLQAARALSGV
jgi:phosphomannomutase